MSTSFILLLYSFLHVVLGLLSEFYYLLVHNTYNDDEMQEGTTVWSHEPVVMFNTIS